MISRFLKIIKEPQFPFIEYYILGAGHCARPFTASPTSQQLHRMGITASEKAEAGEAQCLAQGLAASQFRFATRAIELGSFPWIMLCPC